MTSKNTLTTINSFPNDFIIAKELVYDKCNLDLSNPKLSAESVEYGACSFELNGKIVQHRVAKITPTKTGQFVTIWKRNKEGLTEPFNISDGIDFIIITARKDNHLGQFIFPKMVLAENGIITQNSKEGKRGIRVYPPWDITTSKQAKKTQNWQTQYFMIIDEESTDLSLIKKLFTKTTEID